MLEDTLGALGVRPLCKFRSSLKDLGARFPTTALSLAGGLIVTLQQQGSSSEFLNFFFF